MLRFEDVYGVNGCYANPVEEWMAHPTNNNAASTWCNDLGRIPYHLSKFGVKTRQHSQWVKANLERPSKARKINGEALFEIYMVLHVIDKYWRKPDTDEKRWMIKECRRVVANIPLTMDTIDIKEPLYNYLNDA